MRPSSRRHRRRLVFFRRRRSMLSSSPLSRSPRSPLLRAFALHSMSYESSSDTDASSRSREPGFSASRARESASGRWRDWRTTFLLSFSSLLVPLPFGAPVPFFLFGGSLAVVARKQKLICYLLFFLSFLSSSRSRFPFPLCRNPKIMALLSQERDGRGRQREEEGLHSFTLSSSS